ALSRVQAVLPHQRRRVLRLLLRLLPARSLHSLRRPLHRKRIHHQRRARQAPPLGHALSLRTPRRHHRGLPHLRRKPLPHRALRRRDRLPLTNRSTLRHRPPEIFAPPHLPEVPLRRSARAQIHRHRLHRRRAHRLGSAARKRRPPRRVPAHPPAHPLRPREDTAPRPLPRHGNLLAPLLRPPPRRAPTTPPRLLPPRLPHLHRRIP